MRSRFFVVASGLALLGASPCLALTISSAPPSRDVAAQLAQSGNASPTLSPRNAWGGGRPQAGTNADGSTYGNGSTYSNGSTVFYSSGSSSSFSGDRTWAPRSEGPWQIERRETPAPLSLSPPRR